MSSNAGFATLQVIPSFRNFGRRLRQGAAKDLDAFGKWAGKQLGDSMAQGIGDGLAQGVEERVSQGIGDGITKGQHRAKDPRGWLGLKLAVRNSIGDALESVLSRPRAVITFGRNMAKSVSTSVTSGFRKVVDKVKKDGFLGLAKSILSTVGGALKSAFEVARDVAANVVRDFATGAMDAVKTAASTLLGALSSAVQGALTTAATGGLSLLVAALAAVAAAVPFTIFVITTAFLALAPAVLLVGGAFGALFTILAGGIASIGVFLLAFHGLGKAFTEFAKNGKVSNATLKKLAPSARSFVKEIEKLAKPLKGIAKFVQGKFFDGMGKAVAKLAKVWLPALRPMLGGLAKDFNGFARSVLAALSNKDFVKNIQAGVAGFGAFITRLGKAMGPLIDVFGRLAKASVPFLAELGDGIAKVFEKFDAWIKSADKSGGLQKFMKDAAHELHEIWQIGGLVVGIIGDIITIFFPSSKKASGNVLDGVKSALQSIKNWLDDPKNQKKIRDIVANIQDFADKLVTVWIPGITKFLDKLTGFFDKLDGWGKDIGKFADAFGSAFSIMGIAVGAFQVGAKSSLGGVVSSAAGIPGKITKALSGLYNSLFGVGKSVSEGLADGIRAREESAVGAAKHMGHAVEKATRKALKTHSPSRVFMAIGADVADGLALGVKRGEGRVTKAMRSLATPPSDLARSASGASGGRSALVGSLTVNAGKGESTGDALDEALFALRRIARGGVYAR